MKRIGWDYGDRRYGTVRRWLRDHIRSGPMGVANKLEWGVIIAFCVLIGLLIWVGW